MPDLYRNLSVEKAVEQAVDCVDGFINDKSLELPANKYRHACDELIAKQSSSVKLAVLFLMFYRLVESDWDYNSVPVGVRGKFGDKRLSEALTLRGLTLHNAITAFGENLGWKGNVRGFQLSTDPRFRDFLRETTEADNKQKVLIAEYMAYKFAESRVVAAPLPPLDPSLLTFARAKQLFYQLVGIPSEGHIQQFLIAGLLTSYRLPQKLEVKTHHPHAADKFDDAAGDIEEYREGVLVRAYEVTVRPDWQNRISNFTSKMQRYGLEKYVVIASDVNTSKTWSDPATVLSTLEKYEKDIAVIDILDVCNYLSAELSPNELRQAINVAFDMLSNPKLCGREDFKAAFTSVVSGWLDETTRAKA